MREARLSVVAKRCRAVSDWYPKQRNKPAMTIFGSVALPNLV